MKFFNQTLQMSLALICMLLFTTLSAQDLSYSDSWGKAGLSVSSDTKGSINLNYSITNFSLQEQDIDGSPMTTISLPGNFLPNDAGLPDLPGSGRYLAIPQGATVSVVIKDARTEVIEGIELAPAVVIPLDTDTNPLVYKKESKVYDVDAFYPAQPVTVSKTTQIRGIDAVMLGVTPFQYNPVTKQLIVYRDIEIELVVEGGNGIVGDDKYRNVYFDDMLSNIILNQESIPEVDYSARTQARVNADVTGCEYLIVVPNDAAWMPYAEQVKEWRTKQGILTQIMSLDEIGQTTAAGLETFFNEAYNTWDIPPVAVMIMADYGSNADSQIMAPIWDSYCVSDNIYADVNDNDMPDMIFSRMCAGDIGDIETMVSKMLDYEADPPTDADFYHKPITALGWQSDRWFQICSEVVGGYWRTQGKDPVRINAVNSGTPGSTWSTATNTATVVDYFGPAGHDYIPVSPAELGGWDGGTAADVSAAINAGAFALQHRDHGYEGGWGEPDFGSSNISSLHNTEDNELPILFSINCLTGKYNNSTPCFSELMHRYQDGGENAGALGVVCASEVSYSFVNDTYVWGMIDQFYSDFLPDYGVNAPFVDDFFPAFGMAAGKYFLQQSDWPYNANNKEVTYNLFHYFGGAFQRVYSEVPQTLTMTHDAVVFAGATTVNVSANAGTRIAITLDDQILAVATATGATQAITIPSQVPPSVLTVVGTLQNFFRYEGTIDIVPAEGAYVVAQEWVINDDNGNGMADYGEDIILDMTVKNVGVETCTGVTATLSTTDAYITITDNSADYGDLDPDEAVTTASAYAFTVSEDVPDGHAVSFELSATDGTDTWLSYVAITCHAPNLTYNSFTFVGDLDPGEDVELIVTAKNSGSATAYNVLGTLTSSDPYVTINTTTAQDFGDLDGAETADASYSITLADDVPFGYAIEFEVALTADFAITGGGSFELPIEDYCIPTGTNCAFGDEIDDFEFAEISNLGSGCSPDGYGNFTDQTSLIEAGTTYDVTVTCSYDDEYVSVWIDLNNDRLFTSDELLCEIVCSNSGSAYTETLTIPATAYPGTKRLRARCNWNNPASDPCEVWSYGETEDYTVIIGEGLPMCDNLEIEVLNNETASLTWDDPDLELEGYNVYRDGTLLTSTPIPETNYDDIPGFGTFEYCVTAVYDEGESFEICETVTIEEVIILEAPTDFYLASEVWNAAGSEYDATFTWSHSECGGGGAGEWIGYDDGTNTDGIGGPDTFYVAIRWDAADVAAYDGYAITKMAIHPYMAGSTGTAQINLMVWSGANAANVLMDETISSYTAGEWNEFDLATPPIIDGSQELWIGYYVATEGATYPAGTDAGPAVAGYGDMISLDGATWESISTAYALDYNWNIQAYVESGKTGSTAILGKTNVITATTAPVAQGGKVEGDKFAPKGFVTFVVIDGNTLDEIGTSTTCEFTFTSTNVSDWCYYVLARYDEGDSDLSNEDCLTATGDLSATALNIYPNPASTSVIIEAGEQIERITVYNMVGQIVEDRQISEVGNVTLNTAAYETGVYLIKVNVNGVISTERITIAN